MMNVQRELRELRQKGVATTPGENTAAGSNSQGIAQVIPYPLRPIGTLQSVFSQRNGTPRQPLIVPLARARLKLR